MFVFNNLSMCFIRLFLQTSVLYRFRFMVFNATVNNTSVISWCSILLVEETRVPGENH